MQRLVENPHDEEALAYAHSAGEADPKSYAMFLERVGTETRDRAYAAHWLAEAANVWSTTLGDAHRAARILMMALEKDPTAQVAADRLAQLYRDKGDSKALVALLDRRAKALAPLAAGDPEIRGELAGLHEELARLWSEPPLSQPKKAIESYKKSIELDPTSAYAIYNARELYKQLQQWQDAIPLYGAELELEQDPQRRVGLLRDEAATRKLAGDLQGATRALAQARDIDGSDPALQQEYASSVLDRIQAGEAVPADERTYAAELLVALSETYEGEHGLAYAGAALDIEPGHDRAVQLLLHYAQALGAPPDMPQRCNAYLSANPDGALVPEVRAALAAAGGSIADPPSEPNINQTAERGAASDDALTYGPRRASAHSQGDAVRAPAARRPPGSRPRRASAARAARVASPAACRPTRCRASSTPRRCSPARGRSPRRSRSTRRSSTAIRRTPRRSRGPRTTSGASATTGSSATCSSRASAPRPTRPSCSRRARSACARWRASARATSATSTAPSRRGGSCSRSTARTRARGPRSCACSRSRSAGTSSRTCSSKRRRSSPTSRRRSSSRRSWRSSRRTSARTSSRRARRGGASPA
ncbi:MAG: tetratricopeptide repeat protein [Labilithrix sp.]|nr:tetratricopeptide repeat protein [Labilithrix sp.]